MPRSSRTQSAVPAASPATGKTNGTVFPSLPSSDLDLTEAIRQRAYQIYEARGREDGHAEEDWLIAEAEIRGQLKSA